MENLMIKHISIKITVILIFSFPTLVKFCHMGSGWDLITVGAGFSDSVYDTLWDNFSYLQVISARAETVTQH